MKKVQLVHRVSEIYHATRPKRGPKLSYRSINAVIDAYFEVARQELVEAGNFFNRDLGSLSIRYLKPRCYFDVHQQKVLRSSGNGYRVRFRPSKGFLHRLNKAIQHTQQGE